jgi:hypothetical protein
LNGERPPSSEDPRVHETAQDFIPVLESALYLTRED